MILSVFYDGFVSSMVRPQNGGWKYRKQGLQVQGWRSSMSRNGFTYLRTYGSNFGSREMSNLECHGCYFGVNFEGESTALKRRSLHDHALE